MITASPPKPRDDQRVPLSSVATTTRLTLPGRPRALETRSIIVFPWMSERGFPGRREDAKRAGMIATMAKSLPGALVYGAS